MDTLLKLLGCGSRKLTDHRFKVMVHCIAEGEIVEENCRSRAESILQQACQETEYVLEDEFKPYTLTPRYLKPVLSLEGSIRITSSSSGDTDSVLHGVLRKFCTSRHEGSAGPYMLTITQPSTKETNDNNCVSLTFKSYSAGVFVDVATYFVLYTAGVDQKPTSWFKAPTLDQYKLVLEFSKEGSLSCMKITYTQGSQKKLIEIPGETISPRITVNVCEDGVIAHIHVVRPPQIYTATEAAEDNWERTNTLPNSTPQLLSHVETIAIVLDWKEFCKLNSHAGQKFTIDYACVTEREYSKGNLAQEYIDSEMARVRQFSHGDYDLVYALSSLSFRGLKALVKLPPKTLKDLAIIEKKAVPFVINKLENLVQVLDGKKTIRFNHTYIDMDYIFSGDGKGLRSVLRQTDQSQCLVRSVIITPSRVLLQPKMPLPQNRILASFDPDYILRVSLQDDDGGSLSHIKNPDENSIFDSWICRKLNEGLLIGTRHFEFLGTSNSQTRREHGCYMYASDRQSITASVIREKQGDLHRIKCVAQYVSRLGLAFSETKSLKRVPTRNTICEDDITGGRDSCGNPYVFSDGIGRISNNMLREVMKVPSRMYVHTQWHPHVTTGSSNSFQVWNGKVLPSAIQIRYGGCKGVLALDPNLKGHKVVFRKSMVKYESSDDQLGIQLHSGPKKLKLNRQIITILEQLGVSKETFLELQQKCVTDHLQVFTCDKTALQLLKREGTPFINYQDLHRKGLKPSRDPFCKSLMWQLFQHKISDSEGELKRAKIPLPEDSARNMMGVLDETRTLNYGQVFVQYAETIGNPPSRFRVLQGEVLVSKMPCVHPGDIRKFTAVDVPSLHHMKDVIVFPQRGKRPHPDEMAGSDLDGDEYFVCWLPSLIFPHDNQRPMDFPVAKKKYVTGRVEVNHMVDHLKWIILNDKIGTLSNMHMKQADFQEEGIYSSVCLEICQVVAKTLDGPKTGYTPKKDIKPHFNTEKSPDFFGLPNTYESNRALGFLFRSLTTLEITCPSEEELGKPGNLENATFLLATREINLSLGFTKHLNEAWTIFIEQIDSIKSQYDIQSDMKLLACILPQAKSTFDAKKRLKDELEMLGRRIQKMFKGCGKRLPKEEEVADINSFIRKQVKECQDRFVLCIAFFHCIGFPIILASCKTSQTINQEIGTNALKQIDKKQFSSFLNEVAKTERKEMYGMMKQSLLLTAATALMCSYYGTALSTGRTLSLVKDVLIPIAEKEGFMHFQPHTEKSLLNSMVPDWLYNTEANEICRWLETKENDPQFLESFGSYLVLIYISLTMRPTSSFYSLKTNQGHCNAAVLKHLLVFNRLL